MFEKFLDKLSNRICEKLSENDNFADIVSAAVTKRLSTSLELISEEVLKLEDKLLYICQLVVENGGNIETTFAKVEQTLEELTSVKDTVNRIDFEEQLKETVSKVDYLTSYLKQKPKKNGKKKGK